MVGCREVFRRQFRAGVMTASLPNPFLTGTGNLAYASPTDVRKAPSPVASVGPIHSSAVVAEKRGDFLSRKGERSGSNPDSDEPRTLGTADALSSHQQWMVDNAKDDDPLPLFLRSAPDQIVKRSPIYEFDGDEINLRAIAQYYFGV
jgi:hypothetical protein